MKQDLHIDIINLGTISYGEALSQQSSLKESLLSGKGNQTILVLEHRPAAITLGRHGKRENILISSNEAEAREIEIHQVSRGGDVTVHEPGQLVLYFIFPLPSKTGGIFADILLQSLQLFVGRYFQRDLALRPKLPGLWYEESKVAAIGLDVTGNVSMHGMSLNVSNSLEVFQLVRPCGMDRQVTSLSKILKKDIEMEVVLKEAEDFYRTEGGLFIKKALHDLS